MPAAQVRGCPNVNGLGRFLASAAVIMRANSTVIPIEVPFADTVCGSDNLFIDGQQSSRN